MNINQANHFDPQLIIDAQIDEDRFYQLFQQFAPIHLKLWNEFYLTDMELADWSQEAAIVLQRILAKYDIRKKVTFGSFYKASLKNRLFDLIRKRKAKKRVPTKLQTSLNLFPDYYADTVYDAMAYRPDEMCEFYACVAEVSNNCSSFERLVLTESLRQNSPEKIAQQEAVPVLKVKNALIRCRRKYEDYTRLTQLKLDDKVNND
ncbi:sigma-70 family RNA polymerase sigma factor [Fructilactobacillus sp. Tb1]|uniref:sigma-70 family RNA polymerase sigma factor n=1 Tax=Fructilactobacillus sp. Tb1 TaxID=3422304 RepID=UPI003D27D0B3